MKQIILVTGASRGLGYATASALGGPDVHIIAVARTVGGLEDLDDLVQSNGGATTLVPLDLTQEDILEIFIFDASDF
jgi:short-subunit dehydrogenase